ncbi:MAG: peptidylprolyl isomerase [Actinomycetia bacterium]|nr:peptidylprolyl isomerase [Actinomycetes bacterium]
MFENDEQELAGEAQAVAAQDEIEGVAYAPEIEAPVEGEEVVYEVYVDEAAPIVDTDVVDVDDVDEVDLSSIEQIDILGEEPDVSLDDIDEDDLVKLDLDQTDMPQKPLPWLPLLIAILGLAALAAGLYFGLQYFRGDEYGDAARVNGQSISIARLNAEMSRIEIAQPGYFDTANGGVDKAMIRSQLLDDLINQELLLQKANEEGITVSDADVQEKVDETKAQLGDQYEETLTTYGYTEQDLRDQIKFSLLFEGLIDKLAPKDNITDAMVKEYYDDNIDMFTEEAGKRVSHILFAPEDQATAEEVLAQLKDGSGDFAALAKQYSQDPGSAENGGDLGWASSDAYVTEFKEAMDALELDQMSELVQTEYGWHILKVTETREKGVMDFDEVKEEISAMLHSQDQAEIYQTLMATLNADADIEILDPEVLQYRESLGEIDPVLENLEIENQQQ